MITQSFRSREPTFCLNFHTTNCLLNCIKIRKFSVYNFNFHIFQQNCTLTAYLFVFSIAKIALGPPISQKNPGVRRLTLPNKKFLATALRFANQICHKICNKTELISKFPKLQKLSALNLIQGTKSVIGSKCAKFAKILRQLDRFLTCFLKHIKRID